MNKIEEILNMSTDSLAKLSDKELHHLLDSLIPAARLPEQKLLTSDTFINDLLKQANAMLANQTKK